MLDPSELLDKLEISQKRGTTAEDLTSYLQDHDYQVNREVLRRYRESTLERGIHTLPQLQPDQMVQLEEDYFEDLEKYLQEQLCLSSMLAFNAQRQIKEISEHIDFDPDNSRFEASQLSEFFRSKRFSQSKQLDSIRDDQSLLKRKATDSRSDSDFAGDFRQWPIEQPDEVWSSMESSVMKTKSKLELSDEEIDVRSLKTPRLSQKLPKKAQTLKSVLKATKDDNND